MYIYKTIDLTPLDVGISSKSMAIMNSIERIATETLHLTNNQRSTSPPREVPTGANGLPPVHQLAPRGIASPSDCTRTTLDRLSSPLSASRRPQNTKRSHQSPTTTQTPMSLTA